MAKLRFRKRFLPFEFCHLNFDLLVFGGSGSQTLPRRRARRPRYTVQIASESEDMLKSRTLMAGKRLLFTGRGAVMPSTALSISTTL